MMSLLRVIFIVCSMVFISGLGILLGRDLALPVFYAHIAAAESKQSGMPSGKFQLNEDQKERYESLELFNKVKHYIEANYVDEVKSKTLIQGAIRGMLETLDPHSAFLPPELFKDMQIDTTGKFGGLGIEISMKDNILTIMSPIEDTPAWKAGLKANDRILKIDSESTKGLSLLEAVKKMRGKPKTPVTLGIWRDGFDKVKDVTIIRDFIKIQAVKHELLEPEIGYVRLTTFNESAATDLKKALQSMSSKDTLKGLVFDLRYNPGGLLDQAVDVSSLFIDEGIIVSTIPRNKDLKDVRYAKKGTPFKDLEVIVLVSSATASAAEIVAGALQDHKRATIMGQPTFGKGSVQTVTPFPPDSGLKLTIARYYTPSGRSIQETGVQPDILLDEYDPRLLSQAKLKYEPFRERDLKAHMLGENTQEKPKDDKKPKEDFKKEELDALSKKKDTKDKSDEDMVPYRLNPKEDYQVKHATTALKMRIMLKKTNPKSDAAPAA